MKKYIVTVTATQWNMTDELRAIEKAKKILELFPLGVTFEVRDE